MSSYLPPAKCLPPVYLGPYSGAEAIAIGFSTALWGASCMQMFLYFTIGFNDRPLLRAAVILTWLMTTANELALLAGLYMNVVTGEILVVESSRIEYLLSPLFTAIVGFSAQSLFAYRIYRFSENVLATAILACGVILQLVAGITLFVIETRVKLGDPIPPSETKVIVITALVLSAVVDLSLSIVLCFFMWRTYFTGGARLKSTTSMLHTITVVTVNSGFWTAVCASAVVVLAASLGLSQRAYIRAVTENRQSNECNAAVNNKNIRHTARYFCNRKLSLAIRFCGLGPFS
ncbi:hypothetical protein BC629DRAFT_1191094 [Irpex lacteus]|nr:hypothetical protein BC629DRAFT_1191094 [Irpex lacteus]